MESNIGETIKALCKMHNISLSKLEKETGLSNGQIARWIVSSPSVKNASKVADYFNVSIDYLVGKEGQGQATLEIQSVIERMQSMTKEEQQKAQEIVEILNRK